MYLTFGSYSSGERYLANPALAGTLLLVVMSLQDSESYYYNWNSRFRINYKPQSMCCNRVVTGKGLSVNVCVAEVTKFPIISLEYFLRSQSLVTIIPLINTKTRSCSDLSGLLCPTTLIKSMTS